MAAQRLFKARAIPTSDNGGNGTGGSGGQSATYENPGNPNSPNSTTAEDAPEEGPAVVIKYYDKILTDSTVDLDVGTLQPNGLSTKKKTDILWARRFPGHFFQDYCEQGLTSQYTAWNEASWGTNGVGIQYGDIDHGEDVCGVRNYDNPVPYSAPSTWPGESCTIFKATQLELDGYILRRRTRDRLALTLFTLRTGGKARPVRKSLFVVSGGATGIGNPFYWEVDYYDPKTYSIPNTAVELGDLGPLDSEGRVYAALPDGTTRDVTPTVTSCPYNAYPEPGQSKYKLRIFSTGDITDKTNTAVTGKLLDLYCMLDPLDMNLNNSLTNFQWVIGGKKLADFYVSPDSGQTNGYPVPLSNTTNRHVTFFWYDRGDFLKVHCEASIITNGQVHTLTADTYFNVTKPDADWIGVLESVVSVDDGGKLAGTTLHLGNTANQYGTNRGIVFNCTYFDSKGYTGDTNFLAFQIVESQARWIWESNDAITNRYGAGLDTYYPAVNFDLLPNHHKDSPAEPVAGKKRVWRQDHHTCYLMFIPGNMFDSNNKPVPLRLVEWTWSGTAVKTNSDWQLLSSPNDRSIIRNNVPISEYPSWMNNATNWRYSPTNSF